MLTLYHGSTVDIDHINLTKSRPNKDFGRGFYLSADACITALTLH
jgi:hypothetical protein